jgi:hypothetical protein
VGFLFNPAREKRRAAVMEFTTDELRPGRYSAPEMKTKIPEQLIADIPQTKWGKILSVTPIIMTVVATLLAGLASSEMTRAQYDRALGAQLQSKAGDQWAYFQAKKMRGTLYRNSVELVLATSDTRLTDTVTLPQIPAPAPLNFGAELEAALHGLEQQVSETEMAQLMKPISNEALAAALAAAKDNAIAFETTIATANQKMDGLEKALPAGDKTAAREFAAAKMRYNSIRYETEARVNQVIATLYELQVRKANFAAERHHKRSGKFFFGMLAAQAAVIVSTFAIAARQRNFLWSVAAIAGVAAIIFAIYVYLRV